MKRKIHIKGVIFDFDGVLINTDICHYKAWKVIADRLGIPFDESVNQHLRGVSRSKSLEIVLSNGNVHLSQQEKQELLQEKNRIYCNLVCNSDFSEATEKIRRITDELYSRNIRTAIASSSKNAKKILEIMGALDCFDAVIDGNDITASKPNIEVFVKASQAIEIEKKNCLVVEDSASGVEAAYRAGMKCLCVKKIDLEVSYISDISEVLDSISYNGEFIKDF